MPRMRANRVLRLTLTPIPITQGIFQTVLKGWDDIEWTECSDLEQYMKQYQPRLMNFRYRLLRLALVQPQGPGPDKRLFVMTAQHIIYDALSRMMLFRELGKGYETAYFPEQTPPRDKPGIEDMYACTTIFIPMRVHVDPAQQVVALLREAQRLKPAAIPFEHLGWLGLREP
ncbi:Uu.00g011000.m01.CDS01 [Anthostomella pinea]|uniref:Uu.00g011000.m01.CDS01 n=1 Tax=Anthostomella pinea TaxID=933095 RepID=A0AAI8YQ63_9PEZI|nr:Uu.00g011000.m01.CDS01 [Anthostomella pinea]